MSKQMATQLLTYRIVKKIESLSVLDNRSINEIIIDETPEEIRDLVKAKVLVALGLLGNFEFKTVQQ